MDPESAVVGKYYLGPGLMGRVDFRCHPRPPRRGGLLHGCGSAFCGANPCRDLIVRGVELWREAVRNFNSGSAHGIIALVAFLAIVLCLGGVAVRCVLEVASEAVQWNPSLGRTFNPPEAFHALPLTELTSAAAAIAAVLALTSVRLRRLELASARHIGVTRPDLVGITLAETTIWLVPACVIALSTFAFLAAWQNPDPLLAAWFAGARVVGAAAAAWWITSGVATALIREAHLVRYFQQR